MDTEAGFCQVGYHIIRATDQSLVKSTRLHIGHVDRTSLFNEGYIIWCKEHHFIFEKQRVMLSRQDSPIIPAQVANHSKGFGSAFFKKKFLAGVHIGRLRNLAYDIELCSSMFSFVSLKLVVILQS